MAEQHLLSSLRKPRVPQGKETSLKSLDIANEDMSQYRITAKQSSMNQESASEVHALQHQNLRAPEPVSGYAKIKAHAVSKRERHDRAQKEYSVEVTELSDELEHKIIIHSDTLKSDLSDADKQISQVFETLDDDKVMVTKDHSFVTTCWTDLENLCHNRTHHIVSFGQKLDEIEQLRARLVGDKLRQLTNTLVDTAYMLPQESERIVEREAYELNLVLIANRRSHADLLSLIMESDVETLVNARTRWEACEDHWRQLRHQNEVDLFHSIINSNVYTRPAERDAICNEMQQEQQDRHTNERLELLKRLGGFAQPETLDSSGLEQLETEFEELQQKEELSSQRYFERLQSSHLAKMEEAAELRERLRHRLHVYGAKTPEGDFKQGRELISQTLKDESLEEYFRMAGSLKHELHHFEEKLGSPQLIYQPEVDALLPRMVLVASSLDLEDRLEEMGKEEERKAIQATLEKLRKAPKEDLMNIIPTLEQQTGKLMNTSDLDPIFIAEVKDINTKLGEIRQAHLKTRETVTSSSTRLQSEHMSVSGESSRGTVRSHKTTSATSISSLNIDIHGIRRTQRRLAAVLYATELNSEMKETIRFLLEQLKVQHTANSVVDQVVAEETTVVLEQRQRDGILLLDEIGARLEAQSLNLHEICEKMCQFYIHIAQLSEKHAKDAAKVNLDAKFLLQESEYNFETQDGLREEKFETSQAALRHAANEKVLEEEFKNCLELLEAIEGGYRSFYKKTVLGSNNHPIAVEIEQNRYISLLCTAFGLKSPYHNSYSSEQESELLSTAAVSKIIDDNIDPESPTKDPEEETTEEDTEESLDIFSAPDGNSYTRIQSLQDVVKEIVKPEDIVEENVAEEPVESEEAVDEATEEEEDAPPTEDVVDPAVLDKQRASEVADDLVLAIEISHDVLVSMSTELQNSTIGRQGQLREEILGHATVLRDERVEDYTLDLEERLRQHWPRKGRLDVLMYQPREGELIAHRQRQERQLRSINQKLLKQNEQFGVTLKEAMACSDAYIASQRTLLVQLAMQTSIAALQGLEVKAKQALASFRTKTEQQMEKLNVFLNVEPEHLTNMCIDAVQRCKHQLFPELTTCEVINGCDYHPHELEQMEEVMKEVKSDIQRIVEERKVQIQDVSKNHSSAAETAESFKKRYESCLQALSMKEGLGQKYGGPRRNAQERIRSEIARSDETKREINQLLDALEALSTGELVYSGKKHPATVSKQIRHTILRLRHTIYHRVAYLEFWKEGSGPELKDVPLDFDEECLNEELKAKTQQKREKDPTIEEPLCSVPFLKAVEAIDAQCRKDTIELFKQEGREQELPGANGVPESLEKYLDEQRLRAEQLRINDAHSLRDQVSRFEEILARAPRAAMMDAASEIQQLATTKAAQVSSDFQLKLDKWENAKKLHRNELKPELCSPNQVARVDELCQSERSRFEEAVAALPDVQETLLSCHSSYATIFERNLVKMYISLMVLLDTCTMPDDLAALPGDELRVPKRKSLKRLRKAIRKEEVGDPRSAADDSSIKRFPKRQWPPIPDFGLAQGSNEEAAAYTGYLTHAHRCAVKGRDEAHVQYREFFENVTKEIKQRFIKLQQDEELSWTNWQRQIQVMQQQDD